MTTLLGILLVLAMVLAGSFLVVVLLSCLMEGKSYGGLCGGRFCPVDLAIRFRLSVKRFWAEVTQGSICADCHKRHESVGYFTRDICRECWDAWWDAKEARIEAQKREARIEELKEGYLRAKKELLAANGDDVHQAVGDYLRTKHELMNVLDEDKA